MACLSLEPALCIAEARKVLHSRLLELRAVNEDLHMMTRENQVASGKSVAYTQLELYLSLLPLTHRYIPFLGSSLLR